MIFIVESCDSDEGQVFADPINAATAEEAEQKVMELRDYATHVQTVPLTDYITGMICTCAKLTMLTEENVKESWGDTVEEHDKVICPKCGTPSFNLLIGDDCEHCE